jgi:DNA-binding CsgD family transcriptional regulator
MKGHLTKRAGRSQSQIVPSSASGVASDMTSADRYVLLCDWHGRVVWKSGVGERVRIGEEVWQNATSRSKESLKNAVASVVTLRESRTIEVEHLGGEHFRLWMWPLLDPESAICILAMQIPAELARLTEREKACLRCLAQGRSTRQIADELGIGLTTLHTHLRRSREKLGLASGEALVGFAARYFFTPLEGDKRESPAARKRSG